MSTKDKEEYDNNLKNKVGIEGIGAIREEFRSFFNHINEAIFIIDIGKESQRGMILEANEVACKRLGYTHSEMLRLSVYDIDVHKYREVNAKFDKHLEAGSSDFETIHITKKGQQIPTQIINKRHVWAGRKVLISVARNISVQKTIEMQLDEKNKMEKLRTEFFANISHELKTPLNVILGSIQLLEPVLNSCKDIQVVKNGKYLKMMKQNCFRLLRLINNLIDLTKVDSGYLQLDMRNYNIINIIENITLSVADYIKHKGIELIFDTDAEEVVGAFDADKMERILLNLLSNAIKFTDPKGYIHVTVETTNDTLFIKIKDTGIGIPKEKLETIFKRFAQVENALIRNHEGSGIGLSLVQSLVDLHGGEIKCNSAYGKGTEFIIELPIRTVETKSHNKLDVYHPNIEQINLEFSDVYNF